MKKRFSILREEMVKGKMKINTAWHKKNVMPEKAGFDQRVKWHLAHQKNCSCRPIPEKLKKEMKKVGIRFENKRY